MNAKQRRRATLRWAGKTAGVVAAIYLVLLGSVMHASRKGWLQRAPDVMSWMVDTDVEGGGGGTLLMGGALLTAVVAMAWSHASAAPDAFASAALLHKPGTSEARPFVSLYMHLALWLALLYVVFLGVSQLLRIPTNPMSVWLMVLLTCAVTNAWWVSGIGWAMMSKRDRQRLDRALPFHIHAATVVAGLWIGVTWTLYGKQQLWKLS